jgi:hypothetical protein
VCRCATTNGKWNALVDSERLGKDLHRNNLHQAGLSQQGRIIAMV